MGQSSDLAWERWGELDPYYGVLSFAEYRRDSLERNKAAFFASGARDIGQTLGDAERFFGPTPRGRALDFGCGVGRLVLELASRFDETVGLDVSPSMLAEARRNCAHLPAVTLHLSDDTLASLEGSFDLIHSYNVLQHIPVGRGLALTDRLLRAGRPGGVAMLHYSLRRTLPPLRALAYAVKHHVPLGRQAMNVLQGRPYDLPVMAMSNYPLDAVMACFERNGYRDVVARPERHATALTARVYGRREP